MAVAVRVGGRKHIRCGHHKMEKKRVAVPLVCHGHSRPVETLEREIKRDWSDIEKDSTTEE
ncbi:hypothetical protein HPP92_000659 [Vanilla planifolia]|uniref:Uncharacterized protein n=1 Tax=Vanilla planifolia TaxID=51239 RepID=A0A835VG64_VANPL|nr:hypothetical protein HPP92_000659 [Vanilla planifolia]